jgi:AraC family transcriptional regulator
MSDGTYGRRLGELVGVKAPPTVALQLHHKGQFALTRVRWDGRDDGYIPPLPRENAYLLALMLRDVAEYPYWVGGVHVRTPLIKSGRFTMVNLNVEHTSYISDPMDCLAFYVPQVSLDQFAEEHDARVRLSHIPPAYPFDDAVVRGLGHSLMPALDRPERANRLFLDSIALAFLTHISQAYGETRVGPQPRRGGLAPWQERRVKEALLNRIGGNISLEQLAVLTGLSRSHFVRAFRMSTGVPPHRWLLARRVEAAEDLLLNTKLPIAHIAGRCGFADQSHLTRTFSRMRGVSPGEWRRRRRA